MGKDRKGKNTSREQGGSKYEARAEIYYVTFLFRSGVTDRVSMVNDLV